MTETPVHLKTLYDTADAIRAALPNAVAASQVVRDEIIVTVRRETIVDVLIALRDDPRFAYSQLSDICGVDFPDRAERFEIVYNLLSMPRNQRVRVKVTASEETSVPSVCAVHPCANWLEREVWDMYGVFFTDHPDLRRILTDYGFEGHPQRKDFPLTGYVEVRYDEDQKRVVYEPVKLTQDFRTFDFLSPWEGMRHILPGDEKAAIAAKPGA
jgi:NADH-quinone oxidoreductase subunit C